METIQEISKKLWKAMQQRDVDTLRAYTYEDTMFVHMGVTLGRDDELTVIEKGGIIYKDIIFESTTLKQMDATYVLLTKLKLTAIVDGHEVVNPFVVTEVYTTSYKLASLSYTRINY